MLKNYLLKGDVQFVFPRKCKVYTLRQQVLSIF